MFPRGRISQGMIALCYILPGVLIGVAIQPSDFTVQALLTIVAVVMLGMGILAQERHSDDQYRHGLNRSGQ